MLRRVFGPLSLRSALPLRPSPLPRVSQYVSLQHVARGEYLVGVPSPLSFREGIEVELGSATGLVMQADAHGVMVAFGDDRVPRDGYLSQLTHDCTPDDLHVGFFRYWHSWWNRDTVEEAESLAAWPTFNRLLDGLGEAFPQADIDMLDIGAWKHVLRRSRSTSATGACGFAVRELKQLPDSAILHLAKLCQLGVECGFPQFMLYGRINILAKVDEPQGQNDGRPICVLPATYRLWSSVMCTQLLRFWSTRMPSSIMGGLPGRAARDVTYSLQQAVEDAQREHEPLSGFVLDIIKCFNALPRQPLQRLLIHLGLLPPFASSWTASLNRLLRASSFCGDISLGQPSTTGAPEGDALSVAAAIACCWMLDRLLSQFSVRPALFVDNWAWCADSHELHGYAVAQLLDFTASLRLSVDWNKSFAWSRDKEGVEWWRNVGRLFLPPGVPLKVLPDAKDLGTAMRYRGVKVFGCLRQRQAEGLRRLRALKFQPRPLQNKARLIQCSIWPAIFYGSEAHCVSLKAMSELRTAAARALVGTHSHTNPHLALSHFGSWFARPGALLSDNVSASPPKSPTQYSECW